MANTNLFKSLRGKLMPAASTINMAGGSAYALSAEQTLAQYAATGCLNATFYASADEQLSVVLELAAKVDPAFVAKTAIYCRERGYMKDMPALLAAALTVRGQEYLPAVFARVITNGKMLRNFVQIMRSGAVGRKSLGSRPKKLIQAWLNTATEKELLNASIGTNPSLADVVKMVHPKPVEAWREAFFAWLIGKPFAQASLPPLTQAYLAYKDDRSLALPDVPFQMLTALELSASDWARIASQGSWQMVRMNLNTFARQGVFALDGTTQQVAAKLRDAESIAKARAFPYQLLAAYKSVSEAVPQTIRVAIEDALETSLANVPAIEGQVVVCADVSGSMSSPVTGARGTASSSVRCIDVAALVAAATLRKNPSAIVLPFEADVVKLDLNARDTVLTNAQKLASIGGGGTNCSAPLRKLNRDKTKVDLVVFVSDNESWVDSTRMGATAVMQEWAELKVRNPAARLVCIDVQPSGTTQAAGQPDILNVGGFTDEVFKITAAFAAGQLNPDFWVGEIAAIGL
jgi:60 kDa SS-A/Ro ribonucleoprotein